METLEQFVERVGIRFTRIQVQERPDDLGFDGCRHYLVTLSVEERKMTLFYSQGMAVRGGPCVDDILYCIASDASCPTTRTEFLTDLGYTLEELERGERVWKAVQEQTRKARMLLGEEFDNLIENTDWPER